MYGIVIELGNNLFTIIDRLSSPVLIVFVAWLGKKLKTVDNKADSIVNQVHPNGGTSLADTVNATAAAAGVDVPVAALTKQPTSSKPVDHPTVHPDGSAWN